MSIGSTIKHNILIHMQIIFCLISLTGCTKMCLGHKELGSKNLPIKFYIDGSLYLTHDENAQNNFEKCLEKQTGYKVEINYTTDQKTLVNLLAHGTAQFGLMSALSYVEASESTDTISVMLLSQNGQSSNRTILLGNTSTVKKTFDQNKLKINSSTILKNEAINILNNSTIAYSSPESDVGFLVPRMFLLQKSILPESAIFLGNYDLVLQAISENKAFIGAVSESFLEEKYPNNFPIQVANQLGEFIILAITQELPHNVIAENQSFLGGFSDIIEQGFEECSLSEKTDFKKIFSSDGVIKSNDKFFSFARELYHFQKDNIRVLTPQYD